MITRSSATAALAALALTGCRSYDPDVFDVRLRTATFDAYRNDVVDRYPGFQHAFVDPAGLGRYERAVVHARDVTGFYHELAEMFGELNDPHVDFTANARLWQREAGPLGEALVRIEPIGGRLFAGYGERQGEVVGLGARGSRERWSEVLAMDGRRPTVAGWRVYRRGPLGSPLSLLVKEVGGARRVITTSRERRVEVGEAKEVAGSEVGQVSLPRERASITTPRSFVSSTVIDGVAYVRVRTFARSDGERIEPGRQTSQEDAWLARARDVLAERFAALRGCRALILDLRGNGGGTSQREALLLEFLVDRPIRVDLGMTHVSVLGLFEISMPILRTVRPDEHAFDGEFSVIVDRKTGSAAEWVADLLREQRGARLVGGRTAGAQYSIRHVAGPDGSHLVFGGTRQFRRAGRPFQSVGLAPDVDVSLAIEQVRRVGWRRASYEVAQQQIRAAFALFDAEPSSRMLRRLARR